jgi:exonuclease III
VKRWKKIYKATGTQKHTRTAILTSDKLGFKLKLVRRDTGHFILIKGAIYQEQITITNFYLPNLGALNFIKHKLMNLKSQIDPNTVAVGDINTPLTPTDRSSRQEINKEILELKNTINLKNLTDVYRMFHPATVQYTFLSAAHETFSKTDHILWHNESLNKYKKIEITPCILSDDNTIKQELNNKRSSRNTQLETEQHVAQ